VTRLRVVLFRQPAGGLHHPRVEHLELGLDTDFPHLEKEPLHQRERVLEHLVAEVDRPGGQRGHLRLQIERLDPLLLRHPHRSPGRGLDDDVRRRPLDGVDGPGEVVAALRRGPVLVADMQVDDGGACLPAPGHLLRDLVGGERQMGLPLSGQLSSDGSDRDHQGVHPEKGTAWGRRPGR
jgi:hypothetical protein